MHKPSGDDFNIADILSLASAPDIELRDQVSIGR